MGSVEHRCSPIRQGAWRIDGHLGGVVAPRIERSWSGELTLAHERPGQNLSTSVWSMPQLRL